MSPKVRLRQRLRVLMQMVTAFVVMILLAQLWLFTVTLDAMENHTASSLVAVTAMICSFVCCAAACGLIRLFLQAESRQ